MWIDHRRATVKDDMQDAIKKMLLLKVTWYKHPGSYEKRIVVELLESKV